MNQKQNKNVFSESGVVAGYAKQSHLHSDEESVLRELIPILPEANLLDIGIGGGRTTIHFAKWASNYIGTDYAETMINACRDRFRNYPKNVTFDICDAREMSRYPKDYFDVILFSFNGLDYVPHEDRMTILAEISRIGKTAGYFYFTTHNLNWGEYLFEWRQLLKPQFRGFMKQIKRIALRILKNRTVTTKNYRNAHHCVFNDGAHHWTLDTYYIRPKAQINQLQEYFYDVRVFSTEDGNEIKDLDLLEKNKEPYLGYLCRIK